MTHKQEYLSKIKKLLALSESPVEAEATAALLKARELMAKYKIEQSELDDDILQKEGIKKIYMDDIRFFSRKDIWLNDILCIAERHYPVKIAVADPPKSKSKFPVIAGFASDVEIVAQLIRYIYDSVYSFTKEYCQDYRIPAGKDQSLIRNSYGFGFCKGWESALMKQNEENPEWALVLVTPDVSSLLNINGDYTPNTSGCRARSSVVYEQGQADGYSFGSQKRIEAE